MGKLQNSIERAVAAGARQVVIDTIRQSQAVTLGEVLDLVKGKWGTVARTITIGELIEGAPRAKGRARSAEPPGGVNTRTPGGRRRYDVAVLQALSAADGPLSAPQIRTHVGGTPLQTRTALNRLIEAGRIKWSGKARGTRYRVS